MANSGIREQFLRAPGAAELKEYKSFRTLYVMLGGTGMKIGMRLRKRVLEAYGVAQLPFQEYLWLDTDHNDLGSQTIDDTREMESRLRLTADDVVDLSLPLARVAEIRANSQNFPWLTEWLSLELLEDLGNSARAEAGAAQIRALGRLAFEANFQGFRQRLLSKVDRLLRPAMAADCSGYGFEIDSGGVEVVVLCSLAGGTGSGCFIQAARLIRELVRSTTVNTTAYLLLPSVYRGLLKGPKMWEDVRANAYAALTELNALSNGTPPPIWLNDFKVDRPGGDPFNQIYLVDSRNDQGMVLDEPMPDDAYGMIADALFFDFEQSEFGTRKRSHRCNVAPHLGNIAFLEVPVEDGTGRAPGESAPRYVFRFPTAFGAFGVARVPFERLRLRRAGAAWLAEQMFEALIKPPETVLPRQEVLEKIAKPRLKEAELSGPQVIERLMDDGRGSTFDASTTLEVRGRLEAVRKAVSDHFMAPGLGESERLDRLRGITGYGKSLQAQLEGILDTARAEVTANLSVTGPRTSWGAHVRAIIDAQDTIFESYQHSLRDFALDLASTPSANGLQVAELTCQLLHEQLNTLFAEPAPRVLKLRAPEVELRPGEGARAAVEARAAARALFLPVYRGMALRYQRQRTRQLLQEAAEQVTDQAHALITESLSRFTQWCRDSYRTVALDRCRNLFKQLMGFIGKRVEVEGEDGDTTVSTTGLRSELTAFAEAAADGKAYFAGLRGGYIKPTTSRRNAADLTPFESFREGVQETLARGKVDRLPFRELMIEQWRRFVQDADLLPPGAADPFRGGLVTLMKRAVERQIRGSAWRNIERDLEVWTAQQLTRLGYLEGQDAITILLGQGHDRAMSALNQVGKGASPWLTFDRAYGTPPRLQPLALVGTQHTDSPILAEWMAQQSGALDHVGSVRSDGGSVVVYTERMAFPLYYVSALDDLEKGYLAVSKRATSELLRRHTHHNYLDLPAIRPPRDPEQAAEWFRSDRLALEAVLLNIFERSSQGQVQYAFFDPVSHVRNTYQVPDSLRAIAAKLRADELLAQAVRRAVEQRTIQIFSDSERARQALALVFWCQNVAFPKRQDHAYLEHELATSITRLWRETAEQRQNLSRQAQIELAGQVGPLSVFCEAAPVTARALADGVDRLQTLPSRFFAGRPTGGRAF